MKPLLLLGTNTNIHYFCDVARATGYEIAGIVDDDFHGQGQYQNIPIVAREQDLIDNPTHWNQYQYFCTTNWQPPAFNEPSQTRNRKKRSKLIDLCKQQNFDVATVIGKFAQVCTYNVKIGQGVFVDNFCKIASNTSIGDYTSVYAGSVIADHCVIGDNCVLQHHSVVTGNTTMKNDIYLGIGSMIAKSYLTIENQTVVQPGLMVMRDTEPGEIVSLVGKDLRKIYLNNNKTV
jgi:hypothetical protein